METIRGIQAVTEGHLDFCIGDKQRQILLTYLEEGRSCQRTADKLGMYSTNVRRSLRRIVKRAASKGYSPEHDMVHTVPEGFVVKGVSTYYNNDGVPTGQWVKSSAEMERQLEMMREAAQAFAESIPPAVIPECTKTDVNTDIIPWFNIGDAHIGMVAYAPEVGENFDLKIAEVQLCAAMDYLIQQAPQTERCVIQDMGDGTHYENYVGKTEGHGHDLDYDGRFPKMIHVYVRTFRYILERALQKYKYVDVIINQGNHSRTNDIWMREFISACYPSERVNCLSNTNVFIPYRMGNTFVMCHHSDRCPPAKLAQVMATDYRQDWGETEYHYIDIGHIHHSMVSKEHPGVKIESFNQLAKKDKYAHDGGWRSRSVLTVVYRSKTYGELGRNSVPVELVEDIIDNAVAGTAAQKRREVYTV